MGKDGAAYNIKTKSFINPECELHDKANEGNIRNHGMKKVVIKHVKGATRAVEAERKIKRSTQNKLEAQRAKLLDLLMVGTIDDETYNKKLSEIKSQLLKISKTADMRCYEFDDIEATFQYAKQILLEPANFWHNCCDAS